ncbi:hypothetical protein PCASD_20120 [Puccinia coronata f. sp. avenae]|uniref:Uncharacterized protein n=1 Tax=Puccinia coronata f. sp. avenae TaxID=200324 RepID=A0A2N5T0H7_9BASI|nr:hypothetical protein PCASD_20120 [Puccinia coronata f. sp. avenae]
MKGVECKPTEAASFSAKRDSIAKIRKPPDVGDELRYGGLDGNQDPPGRRIGTSAAGYSSTASQVGNLQKVWIMFHQERFRWKWPRTTGPVTSAKLNDDRS